MVPLGPDRIPYLFVGAFVAVLVMRLLPNAGSFGLAVSGAMVFGLIALMFLDTSINMAMQPFKMMVGDLVNEKQKTKAYSIQSFLCNAGSTSWAMCSRYCLPLSVFQILLQRAKCHHR